MRAVLVLLLAVVGCAYPRAMKNGAAARERGELRAALAAYDRALQVRPGSEEAQDARDGAVQGAVSESLALARAAVDASAWEDALAHLAYTAELGPAHPALAELRTRVGDGLLAQIRADLDAAGWHDAYAAAALADRLVPEREEIDPLLAQLRAHFFEASDEAAGIGDWRRALAALEPIAAHEPAWGAEVEVRRRSLQDRWATTVADHADAQEDRGLLGPALALRARAVEIAGRGPDRAAVDRLRDELRRRSLLPIALGTTGPAARIDPLVYEVQATLAQVPGLVWTSGGVVAELWAAQASCVQGSTTFVAEQPYLAGQREVPNPARLALEPRLREARLRTVEAGPLEQEARTRAEQAAWDVSQGEARIQQITERLALVQQENLEAEARLQEGTGFVAEIESRLAQLQAGGGGEAAIAALTATLGTARERLEKVKTRVANTGAALAEGRARQAEAEARIQSFREAARLAAEAHRQATDALFQWQQTLANLEGQWTATPAVLIEDVYDVFRYEVARWQRQCRAEAQLTVRMPAHAPRTERWTDAAETRDDGHRAWPRYGVFEDPVIYPLTDEDLARQTDARLAPVVGAEVRRAVEAAFAVRAAAARQAFLDGPEPGSGLLLGLLFASPAAVDADTRDRLEAWLAGQFDLESPAVLTR